MRIVRDKLSNSQYTAGLCQAFEIQDGGQRRLAKR